MCHPWVASGPGLRVDMGARLQLGTGPLNKDHS